MSEQNPNQQISSRGRVIRKPGISDSKVDALAKLRAMKEGGLKRTDQYQVSYLIRL